MLKFFQRAELFCGFIALLGFFGYLIYGLVWTEDHFLGVIFLAFLIGCAAFAPFYFIFRFLFRSLVSLDLVKPGEMEEGEELFGLQVTKEEIEEPEKEPLLSSPTYEELYLEAERKKIKDDSDAPDLIELYKKLEDKRN